jgi:hypothetical protein
MGHALLFAVRPESFEPGLFPDFDAFSDIPPVVGMRGKVRFTGRSGVVSRTGKIHG